MYLTKNDMKTIRRIWFLNKQVNKLWKMAQNIRVEFQNSKNIDGSEFELTYKKLQEKGILK